MHPYSIVTQIYEQIYSFFWKSESLLKKWVNLLINFVHYFTQVFGHWILKDILQINIQVLLHLSWGWANCGIAKDHGSLVTQQNFST
jgi:hypothetical protein